MAVALVSQEFSKYSYEGLSTDPKPILTVKQAGSSFFCIDNADYYKWGADLAWYKL